MTGLQVTVLGLLMLFAHFLPLELKIAQKIGVPVVFSFIFRILSAYCAAWIYFRIATLFSVEAAPADVLWKVVPEQPGLFSWAVSQISLLAQVVLIIAALVIVLRVVRALRLDRLIHLILRPILPMLGLTEKAVNIVLVGMTLGLSYGGGMLIQESRQGSLSARETFFSVCLLLLCHGLIEDTMLILLLGADIYGILLFRLVFSFILIALMVHVLKNREDTFFADHLLNKTYRKNYRPG